ncbi:hypothetical protein [Cohnella luojiensis]|uniref:Uncharacterized protein n=1 Tax=Cohnella luojiensis TaxID=652876 RepID=A0A4Y8MA49_9BACL|nr:hypothetical protein [Cohnella luojiensis]TFE30837.1 hypothetical protein E2980_03410 [Cohnella luojiensis]
MTPHELNLHIIAHNERSTSEYNENRISSYLTAYWGRVKRMPELKKLLIQEPKAKKKQTDSEMLSMIKRLHAKFGSGEEGQG